MKAFITSDGQLVITPENETEDFALRHWVENFPTFTDQCKAIANPTSLQIDYYDTGTHRTT